MKTFPTLSEAAEFASTCSAGWKFAYSDERYNSASLSSIAKIHDEENPCDEDAFYLLAPSKCISFQNNYRGNMTLIVQAGYGPLNMIIYTLGFSFTYSRLTNWGCLTLGYHNISRISISLEVNYTDLVPHIGTDRV